MPLQAAVDLRCLAVGPSAAEFVKPFGIVAEPFAPGKPGLIVVGREELTPAKGAEVLEAASKGATVLLLPGSTLVPVAAGTQQERLFLGKASAHPLLAGLSAGDLFLKEWVTVPAIRSRYGWQAVTSPGLVGVYPFGKGRLVACTLDPTALRDRPRVKALRLWNTLLTNLGARREAFADFLSPQQSPYEENPWEQLPPYIDW